jgi:ribonuclease P protein component
MQQGVRVVDRHLMLWAIRNDTPGTRLGLAVGRRHGGAVRRSFLKRRLREAFRLERPELPAGLDLVCIPIVGRAATVAEYRGSLRRLTRRALERLAAGRGSRQ